MANEYCAAAKHEICNAKKLDAYLELATPAIKGAGGKFIVRGSADKKL